MYRGASWVWMVFATWVLVSCAPVSYQAPTSGPLASVRFATNSSFITPLWEYDDQNCSQNEREVVRLRAGYLANSAPQRLGIPQGSRFHQNGAQELQVQAGKTLHYLFKSSEQRSSRRIEICAVPFSLAPREGQQLEAYFKVIAGGCSVGVSEFVTDASGVVQRKEVAEFRNVFKPEAENCLKQVKKTRLY